MDVSSPAGALLLVAASLGAGVVNAVAGGGTLLTFPALIALGLPPLIANATSAVGVVPGVVSSGWAYRRELAEVRRWVPWIVVPSVLGGLVGARLLVSTPPEIFDSLVPFLLLSATGLFAVSEAIGRRVKLSLDGDSVGLVTRLGVGALQLAVSIYGGYFGAGMGILMLAAFAVLRLGSIHRANSLKVFAAFAIKTVAAAAFIAAGVVEWIPVLVMVVGSTVGGWLGAVVAMRVGQKPVRAFVIAVGVSSAVATAWGQWG